MTKNYTCISCPIGCSLTLSVNDEIISVTGNKCSRGEIYAKEEYLSPKRIVTATCLSEKNIRIPVKSDKPVNKELINDLLKSIYSLKLKTPVKTGEAIIDNYKNTGINIIVTRTIE